MSMLTGGFHRLRISAMDRTNDKSHHHLHNTNSFNDLVLRVPPYNAPPPHPIRISTKPQFTHVTRRLTRHRARAGSATTPCVVYNVGISRNTTTNTADCNAAVFSLPFAVYAIQRRHCGVLRFHRRAPELRLQAITLFWSTSGGLWMAGTLSHMHTLTSTLSYSCTQL